MARRVDRFPGKGVGRPESYPWDEWLDGGAWELTPGEDFACKRLSFRTTAWRAAAERGLRVSLHGIANDEGPVWIQAYPK